MPTDKVGVSIEDAEKVLVTFGYRRDRIKGSHHFYINQKGKVITIKNEFPLKPIYLKEILRGIS